MAATASSSDLRCACHGCLMSYHFSESREGFDVIVTRSEYLELRMQPAYVIVLMVDLSLPSEFGFPHLLSQRMKSDSKL